MKLKTSEIEGAALDWAVAQAVGIEVGIARRQPFKVYDNGGVWLQPSVRRRYAPSTDWAQGGPLIECYEVALSPEQFSVEPSVMVLGNAVVLAFRVGL